MTCCFLTGAATPVLQVEALVVENESLHDRLAKQAVQLEAKASDTAAAYAATDADKARLQV